MVRRAARVPAVRRALGRRVPALPDSAARGLVPALATTRSARRRPAWAPPRPAAPASPASAPTVTEATAPTAATAVLVPACRAAALPGRPAPAAAAPGGRAIAADRAIAPTAAMGARVPAVRVLAVRAPAR
jgi:hypothetical protein